MLVRDTIVAARDVAGTRRDAYADQVNRWTMEQLGRANIITDVYDSALNPQRQMGRSFPDAATLENVLRKLSGNFVFEPAPNLTKKRLKFQEPCGPLHFICLYENGPMPEYSIMNAQWRWEPDPEFLPGPGQRTLERCDVRGEPVTLQEAYDLLQRLGPEEAKQELLRKRNGEGQVGDPDYKPGFKKVLETWNEAIRGWRAVLARVVQSGFVSLQDVKNAIVNLEDPASVRLSWVAKTGQLSS